MIQYQHHLSQKIIDWPLRKISEPHETNDVLLKPPTAGPADVFTGNQRFLDLVQSRQEEYENRSRLEKGIVAIEILKDWRNQDPPGRFLVEEEGTKPPLWMDVGDKKARAYISKKLKQKANGHHNNVTENHAENSVCEQHDELSSDFPELWKAVAHKKLYDREEQLTQLLEAFQRSIRPQAEMNSEIVLINAASGTGKTSLAFSLKEHVKSRGGYFLFGKFDQFRRQAKPYSALFVAFRKYVKLLQRQSEEYRRQVRESIQNELGPEIHLLVGAMPYLSTILDNISETREEAGLVGGAEKNRQNFTVAFKRFIRSILDPEHPIVLVLDDCQWADDESLGLLYSLVSPEYRGLLVVGTCRGNEVSVDANLSVVLRNLEERGISITNIQLSNLSVGALSQMIADAGNVPEEQRRSLAEIIHSQTRGNPFYSAQYLQSLHEEGLLTADAIEEGQSLDDSMRSVNFDNRLVRMLADRMRQLPSAVQEVLKVASCLGSDLRENLLCYAGTVTSSSVLLALSVAEERGLIAYDFDVGAGRFIHDKFQEAAFSLIPAGKREAFQLQIGRKLRTHLPEDEFNDNLLLIASLMTQGIDEIENEDEREKLARLCLAAARKAVKESAFSSAIQYIESGISLLEFRHWRDQYELSLLLYSIGAELAYCNGDLDRCDTLSTAVLENARCLQDKMHAYSSRILSLDSKTEFRKAKDLCLDILAENGEHFPRKVNKLGILVDFFRTRRVLKSKTAEDILNLPPMTDPKALASMSIIHLLYPIVLLNDIKFSPLTAFRLVRLTLRYGLSSMSGVGFGFYGSVLVRGGQIEEGCLYGNLALQILRRYPMKEFEARVIISVWGNVLTELEPLRSCLAPYMSAHISGMVTGDINSSLVALVCRSILRFFVGDPLPGIIDALYHCKRLGDDYSQPSVHIMIYPLMQACFSLMGRGSSDPLQLEVDEIMGQQGVKKSSTEWGRLMYLWSLHLKLHIAIYMNDNKGASEAAAEIKRKDVGVIIPYIHKFMVFYDGIIAAASSGRSYLKLWRAHKRLAYLRKSALRCPENNASKVYFLEAEIAAAAGRYDRAIMKFDRAIRYAKKEDYLSEEALTYEKAARMCLSFGNTSKATEYLSPAVALYEQWGAYVKVEQLRELCKRENLDIKT